jgi:hypothetical protein
VNDVVRLSEHGSTPQAVGRQEYTGAGFDLSSRWPPENVKTPVHLRNVLAELQEKMSSEVHWYSVLFGFVSYNLFRLK